MQEEINEKSAKSLKQAIILTEPHLMVLLT